MHKLLIGVTVSPDICFRTIKNNEGSLNSNWLFNICKDYESPKFSYSTGLSICYNFTPHWAIETGLQFSDKGFQYVNSNPNFSNIDTRYEPVFSPNGPGPTKVIYIDHFNYLDIPLRTIFTTGSKKVRFIASLGLTTNVLISATYTSIIEYYNSDIEYKTQKQRYSYKAINLSPTASIGFDWQLSDKFNLRVEPTFRYGLLKIIDSPITTYLWSGGLNLTGYYAFK